MPKYDEKITNPVLRDGEDVAVWLKRLDFAGLKIHPDDSFLSLVDEIAGLDEDTALRLDAARVRMFEIVRDPYLLSMVVERGCTIKMVGLEPGTPPSPATPGVPSLGIPAAPAEPGRLVGQVRIDS